jgi:hypothetical protein
MDNIFLFLSRHHMITNVEPDEWHVPESYLLPTK